MVKIGERLQLIIWAGFEFTVVPNVTDAQQRQCACRDPLLCTGISPALSNREKEVPRGHRGKYRRACATSTRAKKAVFGKSTGSGRLDHRTSQFARNFHSLEWQKSKVSYLFFNDLSIQDCLATSKFFASTSGVAHQLSVVHSTPAPCACTSA